MYFCAAGEEGGGGGSRVYSFYIERRACLWPVGTDPYIWLSRPRLVRGEEAVSMQFREFARGLGGVGCGRTCLRSCEPAAAARCTDGACCAYEVRCVRWGTRMHSTQELRLPTVWVYFVSPFSHHRAPRL